MTKSQEMVLFNNDVALTNGPGSNDLFHNLKFATKTVMLTLPRAPKRPILGGR